MKDKALTKHFSSSVQKLRREGKRGRRKKKARANAKSNRIVNSMRYRQMPKQAIAKLSAVHANTKKYGWN